jgi:hypothetical protein
VRLFAEECGPAEFIATQSWQQKVQCKRVKCWRELPMRERLFEPLSRPSTTPVSLSSQANEFVVGEFIAFRELSLHDHQDTNN